MLLTALYGRTNLAQHDPRGRNQAMPHPRERRPGLSRRQFLRNSLGAAVAPPSAAALPAAGTEAGPGAPGGGGARGTGGGGQGGPRPDGAARRPPKGGETDDPA